MKKVIVTTTIITLFSIGCQEEENIQPDFSIAPEQKQESAQNKAAIPPHNRKWYDNGEVWGCTVHYEGNCLADVIIRPSISKIVIELIDKVQEEDPQLIHSLFSDRRDELEEFISSALINDVLSGKLGLSHKANMVDGVVMNYILFKNTKNDVEVVIPFAN